MKYSHSINDCISLIAGVHTTLYEARKCWDTATKASFGHRENQSIVHPLIKPGNFNDLFRNFFTNLQYRKVTMQITMTINSLRSI